MESLNTYFQEGYGSMGFPAKAISTNESFGWHWHEEFEVLICLKGSFTVGLDKNFIVLEKDEIIIIPGKRIHCFISPKSSLHSTIKFSHKLLSNYKPDLANFIYSSLCSHDWSENDRNAIRAILNSMYEALVKRPEGYASSVSRDLYALQTYILQNLSKDVQQQAPRPRHYNMKIHEILLFISLNYRSGLTLSDCAKHFGFNKNYFSSLFSKGTGLTFQKYVQFLRLHEFEHLLLTSDASISELCLRSGFSSVKTLNRVFLDTNGLSPRQYRRENLLKKRISLEQDESN